MRNERKLRQKRDEPEKILDLANQIRNSNDFWNRLVAKPGDGKSQSALFEATIHDLVNAHTHEASWKMFEAIREMFDSKIRYGAVKPVFICSWEKAIGIRSHNGTMKSVEYMDKEKVPDRFTHLWSSNVRRKAAKMTVEKGGRIARSEMESSRLVQEFKKQFTGGRSQELSDYYKNAIFFCTLDMAHNIRHILREVQEEWGTETRHFLDEGGAGKFSGDEYEDVKDAFDPISLDRKTVNGEVYLGKNLKTQEMKKNPNTKRMIDLLCKVQEEIEKESNVKEMELMSFGTEYKVGYYRPSKILKKQLVKTSFKPEEEELRNNKRHQEELLTCEQISGFMSRIGREGVVYKKKEGNVVQIGSFTHHMEKIPRLPIKQTFLLRATWSPLWDDTWGLDPNLIGEENSLRETDISEYEADFIKVEKRVQYQDNERVASLNHDNLELAKTEYLHKLVNETDWLKISKKSIRNRFSADFDWFINVIGKNLDDYENLYICSMPRFRPEDMVYECVKEFQELPQNPNNDLIRDTDRHGNLQQYKAPYLSAIWEDRIEALVIDAKFRLVRSKEHEKTIYVHSNVTPDMEDRWYGGFDWHLKIDEESFMMRIINIHRIYEKAIELSQNTRGVSLRDADWTQGKGQSMKVSIEWAIDKLIKHRKIIKIDDIEYLTGRDRNAIRKAMQNHPKLKYRRNGIALTPNYA